MRRKALKDFTFSNGMKVPTGYSVAVASLEIQNDPVGFDVILRKGRLI